MLDYPQSGIPVRCTAKHQRLLHEGVQARAGGDGGAGRAFALPLFGGPYTGNYMCYDYYPR